MNVYRRVINILEALADGEEVVLGEFGDNAEGTEADEDAVVIRGLADELKLSAAYVEALESGATATPHVDALMNEVRKHLEERELA